MKLAPNAVIAEAKMSGYLLRWRPENDKSGLLAHIGYDGAAGARLANDIRRQLLPLDAEFDETTEYGDKYCIRGALRGPDGHALRVVSFWMVEFAGGTVKFLTLFPDREP